MRLCRWNAGDAEDRGEDDRLAAERDQAPRHERQAVDCVADPDEPLEEVVGVTREAPEAGVADLATARGVALPARELGADVVINALEVDAVEEIGAACGGGVDYTLETTGNLIVIRQAIDVLAARGTCGIVGATALGAEVPFDVANLMILGKTIRGIVEGDSVPTEFIPKLIDLYMDGKFPIDRLVRTYPLASIADAVADGESGAVIKPIVLMP